MLIHVFETPGLSIFTYLIGDETTNHAVIVDPTRDVDQYMMYAKNAGLTITDIAETHVHADFVSGSKELKHRLLGKPTIHCSSLGGPNWTPKYTDTMVQNGSEIKLGNVRLQALHTPGHTPEHIIWLCYDESRNKETPCLALTGDLLFVGGIGRPDLLGEEAKGVLGRQLYDSLFNHMFQFPDFLEIFPAHGGGSLCGKSLSNRSSTTLGYEKLFNPLFNKQPMDKWLEELNRDVPASPKNFQHLKRINVEGPPLLSEVNPSHDEPTFIIDVRNPDYICRGSYQGFC